MGRGESARPARGRARDHVAEEVDVVKIRVKERTDRILGHDRHRLTGEMINELILAISSNVAQTRFLSARPDRNASRRDPARLLRES